MTKIKICGLSRPEDIDYINEAKPDYCGFVIGVPSSRRNVSVETLYRLRKRLSDSIIPTGVFVNADVELPAGLLRDGVISVVQLHGQEDETYIRTLRKLAGGMAGRSSEGAEGGSFGGRIIKVFSVKQIEDIESAFASSADMVLLDHGKGGTGERFDWKLLEAYRRDPCRGVHRRVNEKSSGLYLNRENDSVEKPFFLAGGVRPDNITEAVRRCGPYGVDLSSAVETEGRKDRRKILAAVAAVRSAGR